MGAAYSSLLKKFGNERIFFITAFIASHSSAFWLVGYLCYYIIPKHFPEIFDKYRTRKDKTSQFYEPSKELFDSSMKRAVVDHAMQVLTISGLYEIMIRTNGSDFVSGPAPALSTIVKQIIGAWYFNEITFYLAHRLLHHPAIYKYVHKQHHEFKATISLASEYAHPVEAVLANFMPTLGSLVVMKAHALTTFIWVFLRVWETVDTHSGYVFPWSPWYAYFIGEELIINKGDLAKAQHCVAHGFHDYHHQYNVGNYASPLIDWLFGTDASYRRHVSAAAKGSDLPPPPTLGEDGSPITN